MVEGSEVQGSGFWVLGSEVLGSEILASEVLGFFRNRFLKSDSRGSKNIIYGFSASGGSAQPLVAERPDQIDRQKKFLKSEYRIMNVEVRYSVYFIKMTERSDINKYSICNLQSSIPACPVRKP
jgi:hypothetical protein